MTSFIETDFRSLPWHGLQLPDRRADEIDARQGAGFAVGSERGPRFRACENARYSAPLISGPMTLDPSS